MGKIITSGHSKYATLLFYNYLNLFKKLFLEEADSKVKL